MTNRPVLGLGVLLTVLAAAALLVVPTYASASSDGTVAGATLLEVNGPGALVPLGVAVLLAVLARLARPAWLRWLVVGAFCAGCVVSVLTIGAWFLPAAAALVTGAVRAQQDAPRPDVRVPVG